ncbi:hypothetical protein LTR16_000746 [Cryomyces antarcticus]|uniref:Uncharacterized protein n=1 Tax=Cryomyces antarcticus TaxID=329879 RepID=A0ABR0M002_9PEZI|nr:hypothetical protein LTR39_000522 [Cryomyces antarcticus]KAK5020018.1 hypothetical protein LTR60_000914 [Cryomyces antarcticus]KAK5257408.1 hypothetical protein LTR16_000746 [Cryomyces antarcticus]
MALINGYAASQYTIFSSLNSRTTEQDDCSELTAASSNPSAPTELQQTAAHSLDVQTDDAQRVEDLKIDVSWIDFSAAYLRGYHKGVSWGSHALKAWWWQFGSVTCSIFSSLIRATINIELKTEAQQLSDTSLMFIGAMRTVSYYTGIRGRGWTSPLLNG